MAEACSEKEVRVVVCRTLTLFLVIVQLLLNCVQRIFCEDVAINAEPTFIAVCLVTHITINNTTSNVTHRFGEGGPPLRINGDPMAPRKVVRNAAQTCSVWSTGFTYLFKGHVRETHHYSKYETRDVKLRQAPAPAPTHHSLHSSSFDDPVSCKVDLDPREFLPSQHIVNI